MKAAEIRWGNPDDPSTWGFTGTKSGRHSNLHNITIAVSRDPILRALVWYDEFLDRLLTTGNREWRDDDDVRIAVHLQDKYALSKVSPGQVREVLVQRARESPRHCVRDWLSALKWDGIDRIALAFEDHWGCDTSLTQPEDYLRAASANFFISLVARIFKPGCKVDTMPVFEGPQGIFKSSALEALGGPWHTVNHESVSAKDFFQVLQGAWIVELSELDTISRAEVTRVKSVISTRVDRYRASYARTATDHPRQCVFAGTTNVDSWGRDDTGLRRFWPVKCGTIRVDQLREAREQLFAEAVARFQRGDAWWQMPASTEAVQLERLPESPVQDAIAEFLIGRDTITILEILTGALKLDAGRITMTHAHAAGRALRAIGWRKSNLRREGKQGKQWVPNDSDLLVDDPNSVVV